MTTRWRPPGGGRDSGGDPASKLLAFFDEVLGADHPRRSEFEGMVTDCAKWDGPAADEERDEEEIERASQAHDGSPTGRARAAANARRIATDASLKRRFPGLSRIGNGY